MTKKQNILLDTDDLDETILEIEEEVDGDSIASEASMESAEINVEDEPPDIAGQRMPMESEETIAEQLVNAGNEEADREQREAADVNEP